MITFLRSALRAHRRHIPSPIPLSRTYSLDVIVKAKVAIADATGIRYPVIIERRHKAYLADELPRVIFKVNINGEEEP